MNFSPVISVVLGSFNRLPFLKLTINSIRKEIKLFNFPIEIIVVDGGSSDGSIKWLTKQKDIITIVQHNNGMWKGKKIDRKSWGYFMNLGFKSSHGKYVCMVSDDCLIVPGAIKNGYELFEKKLNEGEKIGAMAFYWRNWPDQEKYAVGLTLGKKIFPNHGLYLKKALDEVGYIDENTFFFYCGDGDLALKMWDKGYICIDSPESYIEHFSHAFNKKNKGPRSIAGISDMEEYKRKWNGIFYDPAENYTGGWIEKEYSDKHETVRLFFKENRKIKMEKYFIITSYLNFVIRIFKGR